jgi:E3 ubiquitin-protein ligase Topors
VSPSPRQRRREDRDAQVKRPERREGQPGRSGDRRDESPRLSLRRYRSGSGSRQRSRSRDRDQDRSHHRNSERYHRRGSDRRKDERVHPTEKRNGKGRLLVKSSRSSSPLPPPPFAVVEPSKEVVHSNTNTKEKGKQRAAVGVDGVVMEGERWSPSYLGSRSPSLITQTPTIADDPRVPMDKSIENGGMPQVPQPQPEQATAQPKKLRPNRNQGILQAVQAHLGSHPHPNSTGSDRQKRPVDMGHSVKVELKEIEDKNHGDATVNSECHETKPSLLARLSDPGPLTSSAVDVDSELPKQRLSGPEIMARTRARLAKLKNETVAGVLPTSALESGMIQHARDGADEDTSNNDIRARLFRRLEEEKRMKSSPGHLSPRPAALPTADANPNSDVSLDAQAAEVKLRMQAQLRIRLAAAKRDAVQHSDGTLGNEVGAGGIGEDMGTDFGKREELLRTRLKERRS